MPGAPVRAHYR